MKSITNNQIGTKSDRHTCCIFGTSCCITSDFSRRKINGPKMDFIRPIKSPSSAFSNFFRSTSSVAKISGSINSNNDHNSCNKFIAKSSATTFILMLEKSTGGDKSHRNFVQDSSTLLTHIITKGIFLFSALIVTVYISLLDTSNLSIASRIFACILSKGTMWKSGLTISQPLIIIQICWSIGWDQQSTFTGYCNNQQAHNSFCWHKFLILIS